MPYKIAIPSYKRSLVCNNQTLKMLKENSIDPSLIYVFVVEDEFDIYKTHLNPKWYNAIICGKKGLTHQRQFISNYFAEGECILSLDDDVISVDLSLTEYARLDDFFNDAFIEAKHIGSYIWGVYPVFNKYFREKQKPISTCLNYIVGAFFGYINRKEAEELFLTITDEKEDVERSLLYFQKDHIICRYNRVGFRTKYFGNDGGGMGNLKSRVEMSKLNAHILEARYPAFCKLKVRKNGITEVVLRKIVAAF